MSEQAKISPEVDLTESYTALQNHLSVNGGKISAKWRVDARTYVPVTITLEDGSLWVRGINSNFAYGGMFDMRGAQIFISVAEIEGLRNKHNEWRAGNRLEGVAVPTEQRDVEESETFIERFKIYLDAFSDDMFYKVMTYTRNHTYKHNDYREVNFDFATPHPTNGMRGQNISVPFHNLLMAHMENPSTIFEIVQAKNVHTLPFDQFNDSSYGLADIYELNQVIEPDYDGKNALMRLWDIVGKKHATGQAVDWETNMKNDPLFWALPDGKLFVDIVTTAYTCDNMSNPFFGFRIEMAIRNFDSRA